MEFGIQVGVSPFGTTRGGSARRSASRRTVPGWAGWLVLAAFGLRALVPLGFEPGSHSLSLVLCHEGFPAGFFAHGATPHGAHHAGSSASAHCLFCNGTSPAPAYRLASLIHRTPLAIGVPRAQPLAPADIRFAYIPQARAPPPSV